MSNQDHDAMMPRPNVQADVGYARRHSLEPVRERPSAWSVNLLIAAFVLPVSLIPATYGTGFRLPLMPYMWWSVNLIIVFALVVLLFRGLGGFS